ncbi:MAG: hypothetical protein AAFP89_22525 [Bacteroidota bacterium]
MMNAKDYLIIILLGGLIGTSLWINRNKDLPCPKCLTPVTRWKEDLKKGREYMDSLDIDIPFDDIIINFERGKDKDYHRIGLVKDTLNKFREIPLSCTRDKGVYSHSSILFSFGYELEGRLKFLVRRPVVSNFPGQPLTHNLEDISDPLLAFGGTTGHGYNDNLNFLVQEHDQPFVLLDKGIAVLISRIIAAKWEYGKGANTRIYTFYFEDDFSKVYKWTGSSKYSKRLYNLLCLMDGSSPIDHRDIFGSFRDCLLVTKIETSHCNKLDADLLSGDWRPF